VTEVKSLIEYVQDHERAWGNDSYSGRPSLSEILGATVVVLWKPISKDEPRLKITLHENLDEVENHFVKLLFRANVAAPDVRLERIFKGGKAVIIRGVRINFQESAD
jgi:hypothetical protein